MKKLIAKLLKKKNLHFDTIGVCAKKSDGQKIIISWNKINKVIILNTFEEYSGYFLTQDYLSKRLYHDISISCNRNIVKIRTGGSPQIRKNTSDPFSRNFGTTSIYHPVFIEYKDDLGRKSLFACHYNTSKKEELLDQLKSFITSDKIFNNNKIEGFEPLFEIEQVA